MQALGDGLARGPGKVCKRQMLGDGSSYVGELSSRERRDGQGRLEYSDGSVYEGEWTQDVINGRGKMRMSVHMPGCMSTHMSIRMPMHLVIHMLIHG